MNLKIKNCGLPTCTVCGGLAVKKAKIHPLGGGPTRCTTLPETAAERKTYPLATGFFDYFPDAIAAIANLSFSANEQHHPGTPVHWERDKSKDHADTMLRHFSERGNLDVDGKRHTVKMAWRALAMLQLELEEASATPSAVSQPSPGANTLSTRPTLRVLPSDE